MVNGPNTIKDIIFSTVEKEARRGERRGRGVCEKRDSIRKVVVECIHVSRIYILYEYLRPEVYGETLKRDDTFVTSSSRFLPQFSLIRCTILYELA